MRNRCRLAQWRYGVWLHREASILSAIALGATPVPVEVSTTDLAWQLLDRSRHNRIARIEMHSIATRAPRTTRSLNLNLIRSGSRRVE
jgi:hypothetical protein